MRRCPTCALDSPVERDFCECGEYLRWEPTGTTPVLDEPAAAAPLATPVMSPAATPAPVVLTLVATGGEQLRSQTLDVAPGAQTRFCVHVRNQRGIVDHFEIRLDGIPGGWWSIAPQPLRLAPYGSNGPCDGDVLVTLHPPRTPAAEARVWPIRVVAFSRSAHAEVARAPAAVRIGRYDFLETSLAPARRRGRWRVRYRIGLRNGGNAVTQVELDACDDADRCRIAIAGAPVEIAPGAAVERRLTVRPRRPLLLGRPVDHRIQVLARTGDTIPGPGSVRPRGAEVTLIVATNHHRARVPDVTGQSYRDASVALVSAGFEAGPAPADLGAKVRDQVPKAGTSWPRGRAVVLVVAKPRRRPKVGVPSVTGRSVADATAALAAAGLRPHVAREISAEPAGTVLGTRPAQEALPPGAPVAIRVSAGFPLLTCDDGRAVYVANGRDGSGRRRLRLAGRGQQTQPAWTPDGRRLVYRSGGADEGRIWFSGEGLHGGRPLTEAGHDDRRPAVAPSDSLVAFVRGARLDAAHQLCFVRPEDRRVACVGRINIGLSRPVWAPDGLSIVARTDDYRLVRLTRTSASSSHWHLAGALPVDGLGHVMSAAWGRDGTLAIAVEPVTPGASSLYRLAAAGQGLGAPEPIPFAGIACEISWRPDGRELAVAGRRADDGRPCPDAVGADRGAAARVSADGSHAVGLGEGVIAPAYQPLALRG